MNERKFFTELDDTGCMIEVIKTMIKHKQQASRLGKSSKISGSPNFLKLNLYRIFSASMVIAMIVVSSTHAEEKNVAVSAGNPESFLSRMESMVAAGDEAGVRVAIGELAGLPDNDVEKSARLLRLGELAEKKGFSPMARYIYAMIATLKNANALQRAAAVLRRAHSYAEEGCVPPGSNSCDPFGLPRESQQVRYDKVSADYLKQNPGAKYALGVETPVRKIFRDKLWFQGNFVSQVSLTAARNEYESFQLCIIPLGAPELEPIKGVKLEASDLSDNAGNKISAKNIKIWKVGYVKTWTPSYPTCHVGYWPDPLLEHDVPVTVEAHQLQPFWVRVYVPEGTPAGAYKGSITVATDNMGIQNFVIHMCVRAFTLPKDAKIIFQSQRYLDPDVYMNYYNLDKEKAKAMAMQYMETLTHEYKYFPADVTCFYDNNDKDYSHFDAQMEPLIERGLTLANGIPPVELAGLSERKIKPAEFKRFTDHLRMKGWLDKCYVYCLHDEPSESQYPKLREYVAKLKTIVPDVKVLTSESPTPGLAGFSDAWWSDVSTEVPSYNRERQKAGDLVLWYFCRVPIHVDQVFQSMWDSPLMLIDRAATEQRVVFWLAWKYKMDGIMIWAGSDWYKKGKTTWPEEPWDPHVDVYSWPLGGVDNGNGVLFYPGRYGPLPSIRLEVLREGREDYEYLWLLNHLAGSRPAEEVKNALDVTPLIAVTTHMFTKDPASFYRERERLAEMIERLQNHGEPK